VARQNSEAVEAALAAAEAQRAHLAKIEKLNAVGPAKAAAGETAK